MVAVAINIGGLIRTGPSPLPLRLEHVHYRIGSQTLLHDIDLVIDGGDPTLLLGPNGAGKTLLLKLCHGVLQPSSGRVRWNLTDQADARQQQAMVFQHPALLRRSARANIDYVLKLRGAPASERHPRTTEALEFAGLTRLADRAARALSGGEQQRLILARAWALKPRVLFLDEPTSNLDPSATRLVEELIRSIHEGGTKIVMTTHDLGQARRLAGDIVFLHNGHVVERASTEEFFTRPQDDAAKAFLQGELLW